MYFIVLHQTNGGSVVKDKNLFEQSQSESHCQSKNS